MKWNTEWNETEEKTTIINHYLSAINQGDWMKSAATWRSPQTERIGLVVAHWMIAKVLDEAGRLFEVLKAAWRSEAFRIARNLGDFDFPAAIHAVGSSRIHCQVHTSCPAHVHVHWNGYKYIFIRGERSFIGQRGKMKWRREKINNLKKVIFSLSLSLSLLTMLMVVSAANRRNRIVASCHRERVLVTGSWQGARRRGFEFEKIKA